jgi:hypothetical protein
MGFSLFCPSSRNGFYWKFIRPHKEVVVVSEANSENSEHSGGNDSPMFAVTSLLECLTPKNNTNITSVRIVLFQHVRLAPSSGPSPFDIDVYLRTALWARFSCVV